VDWQPIVRIARAVLRRRKRLLVVTFTAAIVLFVPAAYFLSKATPRYRATAVVLLEARPDGGPVFKEYSPFRPLPVQLAILESRAMAEGVLESLPKNAVRDLIDHPFSVDLVSTLHNTYLRLRGLEPEVQNPSRAALRELKNSRVKFTPTRDGIVEITADASEPQIAVDIANTYIEVLLSRTRSFNIDDAKTSREFLERQLAEVKKNLRYSEETLRAFNATHGGVKVPEQSQVTLARLGQIETSLAEVESNRKMLQTRVQALRDKAETQKRQAQAPAPAVSPPVVIPAEIQRIRGQLAQHEIALLDLRTKFTDQHPRVVLLKERIADLHRQLGDAVKETSPTASAAAVPPAERVNFGEQLVALETAYHSVVAQEDALRRQGDGLRQSLSGLGRSELEYSRHVRDVDSNRNLHAILADNLTAARIREQGEMKVVKVIDPPSHPAPITSEQQLRFLALALFGALGIAAAVPTAVEWFHRTVDSEEDVENATGLPVLAVLPRLRSRPIRFLSVTETARLKEVDENFMFTEALRNLRVTIQLAGRTAVPRSILVTSSSPAEGKSTLVVNLGMAFGEAGYRVVLADTDFQRPTLHRMLKVAPSAPGLSNALETEDKIGDALVPVGDHLWMAPRGASFQPHARGLLATKRLKTVVDDMSDRADMVLCDSSPVLLIPDNLFLAGAVDGVILVARSGVTTYRDLARTKALLDNVGAHLLGVVLNEVPSSSLRRHYTRYYRAYVKKDA
jgi:polysaccharide biosynthesis transport protein